MKYPIGIQNFESLRKDGYLYIDKTEFVHKLVISEPAKEIRKESAHIHIGGLLSGKAGAV